jgi:hypothetical protein
MRSEGGMKGHPLSCAVCVLPRLCRTLTDVTHEARKGLHHSTKMNHQDEQVSCPPLRARLTFLHKARFRGTRTER